MRQVSVFIFLIVIISCTESKKDLGTINSIIEIDNTIGFEIETDLFLIHEMYSLPIKNTSNLRNKVDSLIEFRKNNTLRLRSFFSKSTATKSWAEEYYLDKPNWRKIMLFDTIDNSIESIKIEIDNKLYFSIEYNEDKTIRNENSKYLIDIERLSSDSTCVLIEQPGFKYLDYEYEYYISMNIDPSISSTMKNILRDKKYPYGKICIDHPVDQDSIYLKCKLSKIISRKEVGENIEVLQTNTEFEFAKKIPKVGKVIRLRDYVR